MALFASASRQGCSRALLSGLLALGFVVAGNSGAVADFPERAVTIIVPYAAGGNSDHHARVIQPALAEALGVDVVVRNVEGAAGTIGAAELAAADPDGYTLAMMPIAPPTMQPHMRSLPYDVDSFQPICRMDDNAVVMMVDKASGYQTVNDLIAAAREGILTYASTGPGTVPHLAMIAVAEAAGVEMRHLPTSNAADAMRAVLAGTVDVFSGPAALVARFDVHPAAAFSSERLAAFPDTPTLKEEGIDVTYSIWGGLFAPAGLPDDVLATLDAACEAALAHPSVLEGMERMNSNLAYLNATDFEAFVMDQYEINGELLAAADLLN